MSRSIPLLSKLSEPQATSRAALNIEHWTLNIITACAKWCTLGWACQAFPLLSKLSESKVSLLTEALLCQNSWTISNTSGCVNKDFWHHKCYTKEIHEMIFIICMVSFCVLVLQKCKTVWRIAKVCEEIQKCVKKYKSVWRNTKVCAEIQSATSTMSLGIPRHSLSHTLMPSAFPYLVCILTTSSPQSSSSSSLPFLLSNSSSSLWCEILGTIKEGWWYGLDLTEIVPSGRTSEDKTFCKNV